MAETDDVPTSQETDYFKLNVNSDKNFTARSNDVFLNLDKVEQEHERFLAQSSKSDIETSSKYVKSDPSIADEQIVTRRGIRSHSRRSIEKFYGRRQWPKFRHDPSKWKKYSLADVPEHSEASNKTAAFSFLNELKKGSCNKSLNDNEVTCAGPEGKVLFKKPQEIPTKVGIPHSSGKNMPSRFVMPEYVVGQKVTKKKPRLSQTEDQVSTHLAPKSKFPLGQLLYTMEEEEKSETIDETEDHTSFKSSGKKRNRCFRKRTTEDDL